MWIRQNLNPHGRNVGDCTVRAISAATGDDWDTTYWGLCLQGNLLKNMPSGDEVWGKYLQQKGWKRRFLPHDCPVCYTVEDFCREFPKGTYVLGMDGHVLCVKDGRYIDTWDSADKHPLFYWTKEDKE